MQLRPADLELRRQPVEQAMCLMRGMDATRNLVPTLERLAAALASRIGADTGLPARELLTTFLSKLDSNGIWRQPLAAGVTRQRQRPESPIAAVLRDPRYQRTELRAPAIPARHHANPKINNLVKFMCMTAGVRRTLSSIAWAAFCRSRLLRSLAGDQIRASAGIRRRAERTFCARRDDSAAPRRAPGAVVTTLILPDPAFTTAQYDRLAFVYTIVSVRAGHWLIPAFHAAIDADIPNGHDDPLNFDIDSFADSIDRLMEKLEGAGQPQASNAATATDAQADTPATASDGFWVDALWGTPHKAPAVAIASAGAASGADNAAASPNAVAVADAPPTPSGARLFRQPSRPRSRPPRQFLRTPLGRRSSLPRRNLRRTKK